MLAEELAMAGEDLGISPVQVLLVDRFDSPALSV